MNKRIQKLAKSVLETQSPNKALELARACLAEPIKEERAQDRVEELMKVMDEASERVDEENDSLLNAIDDLGDLLSAMGFEFSGADPLEVIKVCDAIVKMMASKPRRRVWKLIAKLTREE